MSDFAAETDFVAYRASTLRDHGERARDLTARSAYIRDAVYGELAKTPRRDPFFEPTTNLYEGAEYLRATFDQYGNTVLTQADDTNNTSNVLNDTNNQASGGGRR